MKIELSEQQMNFLAEVMDRFVRAEGIAAARPGQSHVWPILDAFQTALTTARKPKKVV